MHWVQSGCFESDLGKPFVFGAPLQLVGHNQLAVLLTTWLGWVYLIGWTSLWPQGSVPPGFSPLFFKGNADGAQGIFGNAGHMLTPALHLVPP